MAMFQKFYQQSWNNFKISHQIDTNKKYHKHCNKLLIFPDLINNLMDLIKKWKSLSRKRRKII